MVSYAAPMPKDPLRPARYDVAAAASLLAEPSRVAMLFALLHGETRPASELARLAGVTPQTASSHLARLEQGGMVRCEQRGRGRFFSLASEDAAVLLEVLVQRVSIPRRRQMPPAGPLAEARTCYHHLAGRLGTGIASALQRGGAIVLSGEAWALTPGGVRLLEREGFLKPGDAALGRACLDWTERRPHIGGELGRAIADRMLALRWIARLPATRALRVTDCGRRKLASVFGLRWG
jgi:DNA-binding transcriptional ArsR family regulator